MHISSRIITLSLIFMGLNSCAYYNTFYNTKKYYNDAIKEHEKKNTSSANNLITYEDRRGDGGASKNAASRNRKNNSGFDKTIKQASKVLQFYPDSKYIDDALLIIGESFYYMNDFRKAERKFLELSENFPQSEYIPSVKLWLAKTHIQMELYDQAEVELKLLIDQGLAKKERGEARYWLAESYFLQKNDVLAEQTFRRAIKEIHDRDMRKTALLRLGLINDFLEKYNVAAEFYLKAADECKLQDEQFNAYLEYSKALLKAEDYDKGIRVLLNSIDRFYQVKEVGLFKLELARTLQLQGDHEKALEWYENIIEDHPQTSAALGAYLELGKIEYYENSDYLKAEEMYLEGQKQSTVKTLEREALEQNLKDLQTLIKLEKDIYTLSALIDSLKNMPPVDSMQIDEDENLGMKEGVRPSDDELIDDEKKIKNRRRGRTNKVAKVQEKPLSIDDVDSLNTVLTKQKMALAELFVFQYNEPDSAIYQYLDVLKLGGTKNQRALSFYALAYIFDEYTEKTTMRDSLYNILATNYLDTEQGIAAAKRLNMPIPEQQETEDVIQLREAENVLFEKKKTKQAVDLLQHYIEKFPESELQPRALYAMGWAYENNLKNLDKAYETYKSLVETYPSSDYARDVRKRVKGVEDAKAEAERIKNGEQVPDGDDSELKKPDAGEQISANRKKDNKSDELPPPPKNRRSQRRKILRD